MADQIHIYLNPVRADRSADFERFLAETVAPAVAAQRPGLVDRWQVLRGTEEQDGVVTYAFVFDGGDLERDWELEVLLPEHYGLEEATRRNEEWLTTFAPLQGWVRAQAEQPADALQIGWSFERVLG